PGYAGTRPSPPRTGRRSEWSLMQPCSEVTRRGSGLTSTSVETNVSSSQGSRPVAGPSPARRLRVLCGSAADPLNLLQVMLAKGTCFTTLALGMGSLKVETLDMIASKTAFEPAANESLPGSRRVYVSGTLNPDIRVPLREIE